MSIQKLRRDVGSFIPDFVAPKVENRCKAYFFSFKPASAGTFESARIDCRTPQVPRTRHFSQHGANQNSDTAIYFYRRFALASGRHGPYAGQEAGEDTVFGHPQVPSQLRMTVTNSLGSSISVKIGSPAEVSC